MFSFITVSSCADIFLYCLLNISFLFFLKYTSPLNLLREQKLVLLGQKNTMRGCLNKFERTRCSFTFVRRAYGMSQPSTEKTTTMTTSKYFCATATCTIRGSIAIRERARCTYKFVVGRKLSCVPVRPWGSRR